MSKDTPSEDRQAFENEPDLAALGNAYELLEREPVRALQELKALAERGSGMSMVYLGDAYKKGTGTSIDFKEAEKWFLRASSVGSIEGAFQLGMLYLQRNERDKAEMVFSSELLKNFSPAMDRLAGIFLESKSPEKLQQARGLLEHAVTMGNVFAKRHLAGLMISGRFGASNVLPGIRLFFEAVWDGIRVAKNQPKSERIR